SQNRSLVSIRDRRDASCDAFAVQEHCAGPALAFAATVFCASQLQVLTQHLEQRPVGIAGHAPEFSVDGEGKSFVHSISVEPSPAWSRCVTARLKSCLIVARVGKKSTPFRRVRIVCDPVIKAMGKVVFGVASGTGGGVLC